ncbi:MAG: hypothetical protein V1801_01585 [Candidatus Falkowbacteria bacterium]
MKKLMLFGLLFMFLVGCASTNGHLPKHALTDPAEGISVPHPVELEKAGVKAFTTFAAIMSPDFWTEMVAGGGVFPILGCSENAKNLFKGYCYVSDINYWGDFLQRCVFANSKSELENVKFAIFNRDAGWAYKLDGQEAFQAPTEGTDEKPFGYDSEKFENDEEYQKKFYDKFGMTLKQSDEFFASYFSEKGLEVTDDLTSVNEIVVGSDEWEAYKEKLAARLPFNYKLANGQIRSGHLPLEIFKSIAVVDPGFTSGARFAKGAKLPLPITALLVGGIAWPVMIGASLASTAVAAGVDDSWSGYFGRAKVIRHQLAPSFRQISAVYKELLKKRDEKAKQLEEEIRRQQFQMELMSNR